MLGSLHGAFAEDRPWGHSRRLALPAPSAHWRHPDSPCGWSGSSPPLRRGHPHHRAPGVPIGLCRLHRPAGGGRGVKGQDASRLGLWGCRQGAGAQGEGGAGTPPYPQYPIVPRYLGPLPRPMAGLPTAIPGPRCPGRQSVDGAHFLAVNSVCASGGQATRARQPRRAGREPHGRLRSSRPPQRPLPAAGGGASRSCRHARGAAAAGGRSGRREAWRGPRGAGAGPSEARGARREPCARSQAEGAFPPRACRLLPAFPSG